MNNYDSIGLTEFLRDYPGMMITPTNDSSIVLKGLFSFIAKPPDDVELTDVYELKITIPQAFPREIPKVIEIGRKIPRDRKHHINEDDDSLCLGSPLFLLKKISENPTLNGFTTSCLVRYLYAITYKTKYGGEFIFGELKHGGAGLIEEYIELFDLKTHDQVIKACELLSIKKRIANKQQCPCGCNKKLGKCSFVKTLNKYRKLASRSWFRAHIKYLK